MSRETAGLCPALLRQALHRRPPGGCHDRWQRGNCQQDEHRVYRREQNKCDDKAQDPPQGGKQRHVHVVEHEYLVPQHREAVEIRGPFLMGDRADRCLQPRDVRFECDGHLVAEPPLHARADRAQYPCGGGRNPQTHRRQDDERAPLFQHALPEKHQPQRQERVRESRELRECERYEHEPRLVPVSEDAQPPHRRQRRWQRVDGPFRGRHTSRPAPRRRRRTAAPADRTSFDSGHAVPSIRRASRARRLCRAPARRFGRRAGRWRTGAK